MRTRWVGIIQIALSLVMVCGLAIGCAVPSSTPIPSASEYPADISGRVTITETVTAKYDRNKPDKWELTPNEGQIFWIVDILVKNKAYENAVTASYKDWSIVAGDKVYQAPGAFMDIWPSSKMNVPLGQTGQTTFRFSVPNVLQISEAKICYQGQEPYSNGSLSSGGKVAVYDWDLQKAVTVPVAKEVGEVKAIYAVYWFIGDSYKLVVEMKPKSSAVAGKDYLVELYEKGKLRATGRVSWNQPELNVQTVKEIYFPLTRDEGEAYAPSPFTAPPLDDIFSAKVLDK